MVSYDRNTPVEGTPRPGFERRSAELRGRVNGEMTEPANTSPSMQVLPQPEYRNRQGVYENCSILASVAVPVQAVAHLYLSIYLSMPVHTLVLRHRPHHRLRLAKRLANALPQTLRPDL